MINLGETTLTTQRQEWTVSFTVQGFEPGMNRVECRRALIHRHSDGRFDVGPAKVLWWEEGRDSRIDALIRSIVDLMDAMATESPASPEVDPPMESLPSPIAEGTVDEQQL